MTQRYFGMLFMILFTAAYIGLTYYIDENRINRLIIVWVICGFYAGQYSMRFPKDK
jgi:hypothetical protein